MNSFIDNVDFSTSSELTTIESEGQLDISLMPLLKAGKHDLRCIVTNLQTQKQTTIQRVFGVNAVDDGGLLGLDGNDNYMPLSHEVLRMQDPYFNPVHSHFALEYQTSSLTNTISHVDWSRVMLVLNPLIILIIIFVYWYCRKSGLSVLKKVSSKSTFNSTLFSWESFFGTDRNLKYSLFNEYFANYPRWLRWLLSRLFLFTTDPYIFYGVLLAIVCRNLLPKLYKDDIVIY